MTHYVYVLMTALLLAVSSSLPAQLPPVNTFELAGEITVVDNENDFFIVTVDGQDVVLVCDAGVRPGCAELDAFAGKYAIVKGHFGLVGVACSGRELFYNALLVDDLWQCDGLACEQL